MGRIFVTSKLASETADRLRRESDFAVDVADADRLPRGDLHRLAAGASAVVTQLFDRVDETFLDAAGPELKVVCNFATGHDNVDVAAATARGIAVATTGEAETAPVADLAFALLLAAARRVVGADRFLRDEGRLPFGAGVELGADVSGGAIAIVGPGRIGRAVARRAEAFDMKVLLVGRGQLDDALPRADFVTLHVPLTPETRHLIDAGRLARMKPTSILVNVSRGPVVDEAALAAALAKGTIGAAALDVFEREPFVDADLLDLPNVVLSPHRGAATRGARAAMARAAADAVLALLAGRNPAGPARPGGPA